MLLFSLGHINCVFVSLISSIQKYESSDTQKKDKILPCFQTVNVPISPDLLWVFQRRLQLSKKNSDSIYKKSSVITHSEKSISVSRIPIIKENTQTLP